MNSKYEIILYRSKEHDAFIAEVPGLARCKADGGSYADALKNAQQVITEWIETANLPGLKYLSQEVSAYTFNCLP
jgi:predicted RNase H-like HicB family nuclease